ncbi:hypothetical protein PVL29_010444 [Vitis rotundifolia]|uniref:non-specific serine/threonine protein kinase n=2 Tax=Vitis rotundifolia TaxID=103349 RepID=A0AA39DS45_VITRO|nr:hypothetical protein PVL29_010444 [Vitis rotundifolia]
MLLSLQDNTLIPFRSFIFHSILVPYTIIFLHSPSPTTSSTILYGNETDRLALLAIKAQITQDPLGITTSWNDSVHFCNWAGVTCGHRHQRVNTLNLNSLHLVGSLSPSIGNLTFLTGLNLELNNFHGQIPQELGRLSRLRALNLTNNSFSGEIPANLSRCSNLVYFRLGFNNLIGRIPSWLGSYPKVVRMQLHYNNLTGPIPDSLGNLTSIKSVSFAVNHLEGSIPQALGQLQTLEFMGLGMNGFSGIIPSTVYNMSSLKVFSLPYNKLYGSLPWDLAFTLPNLQVLNIGNNDFTGSLPSSLSNASNLLEFDITMSNFTGKVSIDFGGMPNLWGLFLASNPLGKGEADDLSFLNSLMKCRALQVLDLSGSQFGGVLPNSTANLSTQLMKLKLDNNQLSGTIPPGIGNLVNLTDLILANNDLTGSIPVLIGNLQMLGRIDLSRNQLSGHIPSSLGNITRLYSLHLQNNHLSGKIPSSFGNLLYLQELDLSHNSLNGTIPEKVMGLVSLTISLNLARNQLTGLLPSEVRKLKNLGYLDVSENKLSGEIPDGLGSCLTLEHLHMEGNFFKGSIPPSFISLRGLLDLDLSRNNLSGQIPEFLQQLSLSNLNLSFNNFEGQLPTKGVFNNATSISVAGNNKLCGGIPELHFPACPVTKPKTGELKRGLKLMIGLLTGFLGLVLIMSLLVINRLRRVKREPSQTSASSKDLILNVSYDSLFKATGGFSSANLIGTGGFGSVYKGILDQDETVVAVKVIQLHQRGAVKSFKAECEALRNIRHRNLVKVLTACSSIDYQGNDFKALVYEVMPNGSLENWLHPVATPDEINDVLRILSLPQRLNIAIDVASALDYLHHHCHKPIVHCDLKPSNVLLDNDMTAHVGDFGLARFIPEAAGRSHPSQSSSVGLKGTIGYAAPEYGMGTKVSALGDTYSYGILLLEMFTGKRPTESMFNDKLNLHNFVKMALPERIADIIDPIFLSSKAEEEETTAADSSNLAHMKREKMHECLISILRIGVSCSLESPRERMAITEAIKELQLIRKILLGNGVSFGASTG